MDEDLSLLERGHGLRVEGGLRRRGGHRGRDVAGESTHDAADGGALSTACDGDDGCLDRQRLLGQPAPEASLKLLEASLQLLYWVLVLVRKHGNHGTPLSLFHFTSIWASASSSRCFTRVVLLLWITRFICFILFSVYNYIYIQPLQL